MSEHAEGTADVGSTRDRIERWVVGVDGSDGAANALRWAIGMAESTGADVVPVCAWHVPLSIAALAGRREIDVDRMGLEAGAELAAMSTIERVVADGGDGVSIDDLQTIEGHPSEVLLDLTGGRTGVVVGRRGISEVRHRLLGSVSRDLATHGAGAVVVVPEEWPARPCGSIVVGFDGSDHSQAALEWAVINAPDGATVRALIAVDVIPWLRPELVAERHPEYVEAAESRIRVAADKVDPEGRVGRDVVLHGPRQALAEAMNDADLVVVGPRGIGAVGRTLLGSITSWILHDARCPVAVVPR
jgi:nucleotide-binding universal stress UspA family protein